MENPKIIQLYINLIKNPFENKPYRDLVDFYKKNNMEEASNAITNLLKDVDSHIHPEQPGDIRKNT